jgi:leucyl-tRNA synthetase
MGTTDNDRDEDGYDPEALETKWQGQWAQHNIHRCEPDPSKPKFFIHFAYPGISGYLHVGHMRGFTYTDVFTRYKRMTGHQVLFPVGTHATGNQAISFANKVKKKDPNWMEYLRVNGCSEDQIKKLEETDEVVRYFNDVYVNQYWKKFGFLADWDRFTCTIWPDYQRFIQWQFRKLHQLNLLAQKPYYATFCPNCGPVAVDPSETDLQKGGKAEKHEYTLLKFKLGDEFVLAATLRPETVFGQTNFWVDPEVEYAKVQVKDETWIVSKPCARKLKEQKDDIKDVGMVNGRDLVGKMCVAPVVEREIPILPSVFCDPNVGTGMVTSVPSDAPFDWMALQDIKKDKALQDRFGLDPDMVAAIEPIPIIDTKGMGDLPAVKLCEDMGIKDQNDPKLVEATKVIYKSGFHMGRMKSNTGDYADLTVEEAKDQIKEDMVAKGVADLLHDLSEEVICRCGELVLVKRIDDQWFITYSDHGWTEKAKGFEEGMDIFPRSYYDNLPGILDWFQDRACARLGNWLGTPFPLDHKWTIEPISDSTIYPAYYIVSNYVNTGDLKADDLTEDLFDHVFLGKGTAQQVSDETGVDAALITRIREDFEYWYPVDINLGGKEHQTVHFPVYLMNHVAIMPGNAWPRGIFVNWWIIQKGGEAKISKSKGGAEPVPDAIKKFSVDALRLYYCHIASPFVDVEWDDKNVINYKQRLRKIWGLFSDRDLEWSDGPHGHIDQWLVSRMNGHLREVQRAMGEFDVKAACHAVYFGMVNDMEWYLRRGGRDHNVWTNAKHVLALAMTPFTPHIAEEVFTKVSPIRSELDFATLKDYPTPVEDADDPKAEFVEVLLQWLIDDIQNIIKVIKKEPKRIYIYTSSAWKKRVWLKVKEAGDAADVAALIKELMQDPDLRAKGKLVSKYVPRAVKELRRIKKEHLDFDIVELAFYKKEVPFLTERFRCQVEVHSGEDEAAPDPYNKKKNGAPYKPAIAIETE